MIEFNEKDLEDLIFQDLIDGGSNLLLQGFSFAEEIQGFTWVRQPRLVNMVPDIIGWRRYGNTIDTIIIELKARPIKSEDFDQIFKYDLALNQILNQSFTPDENISFVPSTLILIGTGYESGYNIQHFFRGGVTLDVFEYTLTINGLRCKKAHYCPEGNPKISGVTLKDLNLKIG